MTSFRKSLLQARSHIVMAAALLTGLALVARLEAANPAVAMPAEPLAALSQTTPLALATPRQPTKAEVEAAKIAWRYFQNNIEPQTGLVASVDNYPSTTMWETGSLIIATISAERLGIISPEEASARLSRVMESLAKLPLLAGGLPNKAYNVHSMDMVDYGNKPTKTGIGWSTLDIGRLLASFVVMERTHPDLAPEVQALLAQWDIQRLVRGGELNGGNIEDGATTEHQEGRVGYEQYAAKAVMAFGLDATRALDIAGHTAFQDVNGIPVPVDERLNRNKVPALTTSEPYLLDGLEFGFDWRSQIIATEVYRAQEERFTQTGKLTAVSEGHIDARPYFVYGTVWGGGQPWAVLTFEGKRMDSRRTLSTKAAFAWNALYDTAYTHRLVEAVGKLANPERGWMEGLYEVDGRPNTPITANTNAMVLAAVAFRSAGPLMRPVR